MTIHTTSSPRRLQAAGADPVGGNEPPVDGRVERPRQPVVTRNLDRPGRAPDDREEGHAHESPGERHARGPDPQQDIPVASSTSIGGPTTHAVRRVLRRSYAANSARPTRAMSG